MKQHINTRRPASPEQWRAVFYFNIYRLVLAVIALMLALTDSTAAVGAPRYPELFFAAAVVLALLATAYFVIIGREMLPFGLLVPLQMSLDLVVIAVLAHTSDGFESGYGLLMIVNVAAVSLLARRRSAIAFAAVATLLTLGETTLGRLTGFEGVGAFRGPGALGIGLFATAFAVSQLAARVARSEAIASQRAGHLKILNELNRQIVGMLPTGVLAVDSDGVILSCNARARLLLQLEMNPEGRRFQELLPDLAACFPAGTGSQGASLEELTIAGNTIQPSVYRSGGGLLVFLEDLSGEREAARQTRLAALGRLAAGIAHEIRNPLSAIYQSAQLLSESERLDPEDARITAIIAKQSERIENVVESVLRVSRGETGNPQRIELPEWLDRYARQFEAEHDLAPGSIGLSGAPGNVYFDPDHLEQVLRNLCENARAHAHRRHWEIIRFEVSRDASLGYPLLDVVDFGRGIPVDDHKRLFEPFFTTRRGGTGLGLYIARELCEANHARLSFEAERARTVFRITFYQPPPEDEETRADR